jgi:hypothetical protein
MLVILFDILIILMFDILLVKKVLAFDICLVENERVGTQNVILGQMFGHIDI